MTERVDVIQADRVELLPCPFCGCEAYIDGKTDGPYQACCGGCDARSGPWWSGSTGYARAEAAWNTRIAASEWNEAIDAAAGLCEHYAGVGGQDDYDHGCYQAANRIEEAIRALRRP